MQKQSLTQSWRFRLDEHPGDFWHKVDDSAWRKLDLPHDWSIELERAATNPSVASGGYFPMGRGIYQKTLCVPEEWRGKKVFVEFEGVYMNAEVRVNEHFVARHPYGYTSFTLDLTPYLIYGAKNTLTVTVDNAAQLNSRWYSGSGIYRPVWLLVAEPVHIAQYGVYVTTPEVSPETARIRVSTQIANETTEIREVTLRSQALVPDGAAAGEVEARLTLAAASSQVVTQELVIARPQCWSPDAPLLYRLESTVLAGEHVVDSASTTFGIRSLKVDARLGFLINDQPVKMKGGCVHHDNGVMGSASYPRSEERKVELLKASGYNAIRCAHNPPAPSFLDACDRLGMLVIDEAFDCWRDGKNPYDYHAVFDDWWERDIESMVRRDRNHPSVVVWSIGNELMERGRPEGAAIARQLADAVRALDSTRPVTAAICGSWDGWPWPNTDGVFSTLDIGGYNYLWSLYESDHVRLPQRVMFGTESFPKESFENWMAVLDHSYMIGDFVWTSWDYLGESGIGRVHFGDAAESFLGKYPWHQANCGDLDLCGFKRPQSYYRDVLWKKDAGLYIAVHAPIPEGKTPTITMWGWPDVQPSWNWAGHEGKTFTVDVYSPFKKVELFLNGRSLGSKPANRQEKFIASFEVPYEPGELKAVGNNGTPGAGECILRTVETPVQIRLTPDRDTLSAGPDDLGFVTVELVDGAGNVHPDADQLVYFTIQGEGSLAAVGSGDPTNTERYRGNVHSTYHGRCLVVVKSNGKAGEIHLRAQADGLESAEVVIRSL